MQALFSRRAVASSNLTKWLTKPVLSHHNETFASLSKPTQSHLLLRSSSATSGFHASSLWRSQNTPSGKIHGVFPNLVLTKHFVSNLSNAHSRVKLKSFVDSRVGFFSSQFRRRRFDFEGRSGFQWRGWTSWFQGLSANDVVLGLIIANVAVFMLWRVADPQFMRNHFMISLDNFKSGRVHTLITSAFSHIDVGHIISNMIGLYFFGVNIVRVFGPEYLLKLYLAGAIGGSVFYLIHHGLLAAFSKGQGTFTRDPSRTPGLGASGAVNAIMLLDMFLHPKATIYFEFIIPVPAMLLGIFLIGKDVLRIIEGDRNISGSAHLGGAAVAAMAWFRIRKGWFRF